MPTGLMEARFGVRNPATESRPASVVEITNDGRWPIEVGAVRAVLADYFGPKIAGSQMGPPAEQGTLRATLRASAPALADLTAEVAGRFNSGAAGIVVRELGLREETLDDKRKTVYALSVLLGDVVWTHPVDNRVIWDVTNKEGGVQAPGVESAGAKHSNFSENDREADYHTDASFAAVPDRYFLLYSVQAAECGGGQTFLTDARRLTEELLRTEQGRAAIEILEKTSFPMRVPKAFRSRAEVGSDGHSWTPIIANGSMWRFRKDKIDNGLAKYPELATPQVRAAVATAYRRLHSRQDEYRAVTPTDAVLIVDNHVTLHGRTAFTDFRRHLLRARFDKSAT